MQKYFTRELRSSSDGFVQAVYRASEVDAELEKLKEAARNLLQYLDDHDWGHVPEGETADRLRELSKL